MKYYYKLLCCFLAFALISPTNSYSQLFKKIDSDDGDFQKDCNEVIDDIYTIDIGVILNNNSNPINNNLVQKSQSEQSLPCDLHVGFTIHEINQTFYEPLGNLGSAPSNSPDLSGVMSISFNGSDYELDCQNRQLTVTVDFYCNDGGVFTPVDVCNDRRDFSNILPISEINGCSASRTFTFDFCCGGEVAVAQSVNELKNKINISQINIKLQQNRNGELTAIGDFSKNDQLDVDIFTISGQKIANTQFYKESDNKIRIKNNSLSFGYYLVRIINNGHIQTLKFINL